MTDTKAGQEPRVAADDEYLRAAADGDEDAWQRLYDRFAPAVHGIAIAHVGVDDAADLTQEVFVTVLAKLGTVRESLAPWICSVTRHAAIDHLRRRGRRPIHEPLRDVAARDGRDPGHGLGEMVLAAIQDLPEAYRETLILRLLEGLSGPEIADRTGLTHGSVRVNLCRGMAMLRPLLREGGWS